MPSEKQNSTTSSNFCVAQFSKSFDFNKPIEKIDIKTSGDTFFRLFVNGKQQVVGQVAVGGDFLSFPPQSKKIEISFPPQYYATEVTIRDDEQFDSGRVDFVSIVRSTAIHFCECSRGQGGFFLTAYVTFKDGTTTIVATDEDWDAEQLCSYCEKGKYDNSFANTKKVNAQKIENVWHCFTAPIKSCKETLITPKERYVVHGGETREIEVDLGMIYAGYPYLKVTTNEKVFVEFSYMELQNDSWKATENCCCCHDDTYVGLILGSAKILKLKVVNYGKKDATVIPSFVTSHYPTTVLARTKTSDKDLNKVLDVCAHTLKYCRQSMHIDSPKHCEPLACTGDYYIQSLMTLFSFGDMSLASFDVRRTARILQHNDGKMFHTSYSLIWVLMLWDTFWATGDKELLFDCQEALLLLLKRFESYLGENGIIETPPDFMFVDWLIVDGISLHHPPKALGQTCLNLFYFGALKTAKKIFDFIDQTQIANEIETKASKLQKNIIELLYDKDKGLFFEGLNTPTPTYLQGMFTPQNVAKRYYRKHANILATYFQVFDREQCQMIVEKVMNDTSLGEVQPYFAHFLLESILKNGLREKYTLQVLNKWKKPVLDCPYGLVEGFYKPDLSYRFDHSHAWGGTPLCSLPMALTGLKVLEAGYKKISLDCSLLGLEYAYVEIPTKYGLIEIKQEKGKETTISCPKEIDVTLLDDKNI